MALWSVTIVILVAIALALGTGIAARPSIFMSLLVGAAIGLAMPLLDRQMLVVIPAALLVAALTALGIGPIQFGEEVNSAGAALAGAATGLAVAYSASRITADLPFASMDRHDFERFVIRFLIGFGFVVFTASVLIPFGIMVATSLKSQQELLQNPLDYSIDLTKGWDLLRSYRELFVDYSFGKYLWTSFYVSVATVLVTLLFSVPGAYAVARLRFAGQRQFSQSILLIYMVPMIVLALPIYMAFSVAGLRNSILGIVMIYPVTTIPVALYILQGYFKGIPVEIEEAGLMDGLSRLSVIRRITLPLCLPALASVSLYVFMIAWNEFLLAFMLLDDPSKFTLRFQGSI